MIKITFPDGSIREYNEGVTGSANCREHQLNVWHRMFWLVALMVRRLI